MLNLQKINICLKCIKKNLLITVNDISIALPEVCKPLKTDKHLPSGKSK